MSAAAQIQLLPAEKVAEETRTQQSPNGIRYATFGETHLPQAELERVVQAVPTAVAAALTNRAYYFVPLTIGETEETLVAAGYTLDLSDRAVCHRNFKYGSSDCIFISTRLMQDRFALAFEFFINVGHHFVEAAGVPQSFSDLVWSQAEANVRGETSQDAWESRRRATDKTGDGETAKTEGATAGYKPALWQPVQERSEDRRNAAPNHSPDARHSSEKNHSRAGDESAGAASPAIDERARNSFFESAFADAIAIYMLSLMLDFDYFDLREREYPLLAAPALAERLRHVAGLFHANPGYEFQISYRRRA